MNNLYKKFHIKFMIIIILVLLVPFGLYTIYQIAQKNENEALIQQIYQRQLENLLFSVNQYCWDIFSSWITEISSEVLSHQNQIISSDSENIFQDLFRQQSIKGVYFKLRGQESHLMWSPQYKRQKISIIDRHIKTNIESYIKTSRQEQTRMIKSVLHNYIQPIIISGKELNKEIRDLNLFIFPLRYTATVQGISSSGGIFLSAENFIQQIIIQKLRTLNEGNFIFTIYNSNSKKTIYLSNYNKISEPGLNQARRLTAVPAEIVEQTGSFEKEEQLWLLPGYILKIKIEGDTIADIARTRTNQNVLFLLGVNILLIAGGILLFIDIYKKMKLARMKTDFVANVSHELRTPLTLIRLYAESLDMGRVSPESKKQAYYKTIINESERLTKLINNILDFSKIESKKKEFHFQKTDLSQLTGKIVELYQFHLEQKGFQLTCKCEQNLPHVSIDRETVELAIINILDNAVKFSPKQKNISIRLEQENDNLVFSIKDKGTGISPSEYKRIFEKFYRIENSLTSNTRGSGLGLSLVKYIMESHQGKVRIESKPGKGSTFFLIFPIRFNP